MNSYFAFLEELDQQAPGVLEQAIDILQADPAVSAVVKNSAVGGLAPFAPYRGEQQAGRPFFGAVEFRTADAAHARALFARIAALGATVHGYDVTPLVEKDELTPDAGGHVPGLKTLRGISFHPDLPKAAARRCWDHHVELALQLHGFDKYVRYWVNDCLTENSPRIGGITNLQFASEKRMRERYFVREGASELVFHDVTYFISGGTRRLLAAEQLIAD